MNRDQRAQRRQLDQALDRMARQLPSNGNDSQLDPALTNVAHHLFRLSSQQATNPDEQFVTRLERSLMSSTHSVATTLPEVRPGQQTPSRGTRSATTPRRTRTSSRDRRGWSAWVEIGSIAAVLVLLLGAIVGPDRLLDPFRRTNNTAVHQPANPGPEGMYRGNAARTGVMPSLGPEGEPGIRWRVQNESLFSAYNSSPIVAGGTLYVASNNEQGLITAINTANGSQRWQATVGMMGGVSPVIANGLVYVAGEGYPETGGYLIALDAATGVERWRYKTGWVQSSSPVVANGSIFVVAEDETLRAVDALTGTEQWRFSLDTSDLATPQPGTTGKWAVGGATAVSPVVSDGIVYAASDDGVLFAIDAATGNQRWRFLSDANYLETPAVADGTLYLIAQLNTRDPELRNTHAWVYALDAATGEQRWVWHDGNTARPPTVANGLVYITNWGPDTEATLLALDAATGVERWSSPDGGDGATPVIAGTTLYTTSGDGGLYAINGINGETLWRIDLGVPQTSDLVIADGAIFLAANGTLFAFGGSETAPGTPVATPIVDGDASGLPPCTVEPRDESEMTQEGTPTADLAPDRPNWVNATRQPILISEVPEGPQPSQDVIDGILQTLHDIAACDRPGYERYLAALVTDDYLRRDSITVRQVTEYANGQMKFFFGAVNTDGTITTALADVRQLSDGRVGVLRFFGPNAGNGEFTVFAQQDGRWLIDESRQVSPTLDMQG